MPPHVAVDEGDQIVGVGVVGVELDGGLQFSQRLVVQPTIVEGLPAVESGYGAVGFEPAGLIEPLGGLVHVASGFLGEAQLDDGRYVFRVAGNQRLEFGDCFRVMAQRCVGAAELPSRVPIVGLVPQAVLQFGHAGVVVTRRAISRFKVVLRHLHFWVEFEGSGELLDGLGDEPFLVVEDSEIVMGTSIGRVDPLGKRAEDRHVAFRDGHGSHPSHPRRMASKIARRDAISGRSRKCAGTFSFSCMKWNWVSTQRTTSRSFPKVRYVLVRTAAA